MSENLAWVGNRIRSIRAAKGWSQGDLATRMGRTQTAVSYWEAGRRALGVDDLVEVANALGVPTSELLPDRPPGRPVPALLRAVAEDVDAHHLADQLEKFVLTAQELTPPEVRWIVTPTSPRNTAETLLSVASITKTPVPVKKLAEECGVLVLFAEFDNVDGLIVKLDFGAVIGVYSRQVPTRQRFTIAHELGHYLLRHSETYHLDFGGDLSPGATGEHPEYNWRDERAANDFAANLLMPASFVRSAFNEDKDVGRLAKKFDVSVAAMGFRLKSLGLA